MIVISWLITDVALGHLLLQVRLPVERVLAFWRGVNSRKQFLDLVLGVHMGKSSNIVEFSFKVFGTKGWKVAVDRVTALPITAVHGP